MGATAPARCTRELARALVAAAPVPLAGRDGARPGGGHRRGRPGRAGRGGAPGGGRRPVRGHAAPRRRRGARWRPTRSRCHSATAASTWCWRRSASTTWAASPLAWPRPGGLAPRSRPARSRRAGPIRPRRQWMMPSGRSATGRRPGTRPWRRDHGPATRRRWPGAPPRRVSPASRPAPRPSRPGSRPPPSWRRGDWAWPTSPRSCARWTRRAAPRCAGRLNSAVAAVSDPGMPLVVSMVVLTAS